MNACPDPDKRHYIRQDAERVCRKARRKGGYVRTLAPYLCPCGLWATTTRTARPTPDRRRKVGSGEPDRSGRVAANTTLGELRHLAEIRRTTT